MMNFGRAILLAEKASPNILFAAGIVGVVGGTVLACRATLKMEEVLKESKRKLDLANTLEHEDYNEDDRVRDVKLIKFQAGVKIVKTYAPAVLVTGLSIAALTKSHVMLTHRVTALTAAYAVLDEGFRKYRARVIDKYGEEEDRKLLHGVEQLQIEDPKTKKKKTIDIPGNPSIYARFFDEYSTSWDKDPEVNRFFLESQQNWANNLLNSRGHVFLNEVYDMVGVARSTPGSIVGWILTDDDSTDNFIDFGIFKGETQAMRAFVNGSEGAILLDFNVDGIIYDKIDGLPEELRWQLGH
jgi:hypothetical protein